MSGENNGKVIDFDDVKPSKHEPLSTDPVVKIGDRFKFTIDAFNWIMQQQDASTVVVVLSEIKIEDDGSKTLIVVPA